MRIILLNAPPRAGKDTVANIICSAYPKARHLKLSYNLKNICHKIYNLDVKTEHFDDKKDIPSKVFLGKTPREIYIQFSELYMKAIHGENIWYKLLYKEIMNDKKSDIFVISDLGFQKEYDNFLQDFGEMVSLIKISRDGCDFKNDSRGYVEGKGKIYELTNNSSLCDLTNNVKDILYDIVADSQDYELLKSKYIRIEMFK